MTKGTVFFDDKAVRRVKKPDPKGRSKLVYMHPADFLRLAKNGYTSSKEQRIEGLIEKGIKITALPYLILVDSSSEETPEPGHLVDWEVVGHEGRHRTRVLLGLGVTLLPVLLKHKTRAWSEGSKRPKSIRAQAPRSYKLEYKDVVKKEYR